eukprot:Hpha_TRINITY_DN16082_c4_g6::TRINITY_DN16082_c4_g6_i1::g.120169::m.120169
MSAVQYIDTTHLEVEHHFPGVSATPPPSPFVHAQPGHMAAVTPRGRGGHHTRTISTESWEFSEEAASVAPLGCSPAPAPFAPVQQYESSPPRPTRWRFEPYYSSNGWMMLQDDEDTECSAPNPVNYGWAEASDFVANPCGAEYGDCPCPAVDSVQSLYLPPPPPPVPTAAHKVTNVPARANPGMTVATVQFKYGRQESFACTLGAEPGEYVIVHGDRGEDIGQVTEYRLSSGDEGLPRVLRFARESEVRQWEALAQDEARAVPVAQEIIDRHNVNIRIVHAEYQFDKKKLTFHFTSKASKPQVKEALSDCFAQWRCRIWFSRISKLAPGNLQ